VRAAIAIALCAACSQRAPHQAPAPKPAPLAHASQGDLAREVDDADRHGTYGELRARWVGQSLHWTVTRQRQLCLSPEACHVAAFPIQRPATHGWMPALVFAPGEFAKLEAGCGAAAQCQLEIEGTLGELAASAELPTSLVVRDVRVIAARG